MQLMGTTILHFILLIVNKRKFNSALYPNYLHCTILTLLKLNQNIHEEAAQRSKSLCVTNCGPC
jgi:hypothetical protein